MSLNFQSYGAGRPLVLMHGLFGSGDNLRVLARGLEESYRVILPDLPNHGDSPHIQRSTHLAMAEAVEEFLETESIQEPVIGGHSIGGKIAMLLALRNPGRFNALIIIDMAPRPYEASHLEIIAAMRSIDPREITSRREADEAMARAVPHAGVRSFLLKNLVREDDRYRWRLNINAISADYDSMLTWDPPDGQYDRPALFVGGERSRYLQVDRDQADIRRQFPRAEIHMIPDAGHWLHADKPSELLEIMERFLSKVELA